MAGGLSTPGFGYMLDTTCRGTPPVCSRNCRRMLSTVSHSGPRPLSSSSSTHSMSTSGAASAEGKACSKISRARARTLFTCRKKSSIERQRCDTSRWKPRKGPGRERNGCGICFSCRFKSLRNPATLSSKYCACWFATSTAALYSTAKLCWARKASTGAAQMRNSRTRWHSDGLSPCAAGIKVSNLCNCASSMRRPARTRPPCNRAKRAENSVSQSCACARMRKRSSSTMAKSSSSKAVTRASISESSAGVGSLMSVVLQDVPSSFQPRSVCWSRAWYNRSSRTARLIASFIALCDTYGAPDASSMTCSASFLPNLIAEKSSARAATAIEPPDSRQCSVAQ
mmetsp:Transcript_26355/g.76026  ORF Transcript_26355/g.76026 Transcript_26355/m.76026 type:complete len:341 (+) Transcript_26355:452-1474(+)